MIFATILTLCTTMSAPCNEYIVDVAPTAQEAAINTSAHDIGMRRVWDNDKALSVYLSRFNVSEDVKMVQTYEYRSEIIPDEEMP